MGPIGVVLAGGRGRRMGAAKATVQLAGRPLLSYALEAVWRALGEVSVVAKSDTPLPSLPGVRVWIEPDADRHPLAGIVHALRCSQGRAVLSCPVDLPLIEPATIARLAGTDSGWAPAVLAAGAAGVQPLLGCFQPTALAALADALRAGHAARAAVQALEPRVIEVPERELLNVNTPADLRQAAALIDRRRAAP